MNDCFESPMVITMKTDKLVKRADSQNLKDSYIKIRPHIPNVENLLNQVSVTITTRDRTVNFSFEK